MIQRRYAPARHDDERVSESPETSSAPAFAFEPFTGNPYRTALQTPISEIAADLQHLLSRKLTAYAVGVRDAKTITRWASNDDNVVRSEHVERRLRTTYQVALMLLSVDAPSTVKAWFLGANPDLGDVSPIEMIRQDADREVISAARSFVADA
jgi:hypothetical protein